MIFEKYVMWRVKMWPYDPDMCGFYDVSLVVLGAMLTSLVLR